MKIAIVGQGVIGVSTTLAILKWSPKAKITLFGDRPFEKTTSFGPAGLFRLDKYENKAWAKATFDYLAETEKQFPSSETGVKLLSGHIQSNEKYNLKKQKSLLLLSGITDSDGKQKNKNVAKTAATKLKNMVTSVHRPKLPNRKKKGSNSNSFQAAAPSPPPKIEEKTINL